MGKAFFCKFVAQNNLLQYDTTRYKNILDAIKSRRSIRKYKKTPVPQELIDRVIEAGTYAATGKSQQPWLVVQVTDEATKIEFVVPMRLLWEKAKMLTLSMVLLSIS